MKSLVPLTLLVAGLLLAGCSSNNSDFSSVPGPSNMNGGAATAKTTPPPAKATKPSPAIVTPDNSLGGKVVSYNAVGRFVVLNFPNRMPKTDQVLSLYRGGLKVGEIKVTGPERDNNTVADVTSGEARIGDDVRDR